MNKYIATWIYLDTPEEKSKYPNNKGDSTSPEFQAVYWRCVVLFYETSLRFHKDCKHLLFTNTKDIPIVDRLDLNTYFKENAIEVIPLKNKYPLPNNYFGLFRNQFFEFTIIDYLATRMNDEDGLLLLDSDCVFAKPMDSAFTKLANEEYAMTYIVDYERDYHIHGVTGDDMKELFVDFGLKPKENPYYSGGELLFANGKFFKVVAHDFKEMFQNLIERHKNDKKKFNEEAHVLSFFYYKYQSNLGGMDSYIKRLWTNKNYFRNVESNDRELNIWHLPNEKKTGIHRLFNRLLNERLTLLSEEKYQEVLYNELLHPKNYKTNFVQVLRNKVSIVMMNLGLKIK